MDLLPPSITSSDNAFQLEVPYLNGCNSPYHYHYHYNSDPSDWSSYPTRAGWDKSLLLQPRDGRGLAGRSPDEAAAFLQAWLFFGTISALTVSQVSELEASFTTLNAQGEEIITCAGLMRLLQAWMEDNDDTDEKKSMEVARRGHAILVECCAVVKLVFELEDGSPWTKCARRSLLQELALSVSFLGTALNWAKGQVATGMPVFGHLESLRFPLDRRVVDELLKLGYCPSEVRMLREHMASLTMYYVCLMGPRHVNRNHSACGETECMAMMVDTKTYRTAHTSLACDCEHIATDPEELLALVVAGRTPVVTFAEGDLVQSPRLTMHERVSDVPYVIISHVWADGLGNAHANSLPVCQLARLQEFVDELLPSSRGHMPFWIDALCIPVAPADSRKIAIRQMAQIYSNAARVLLLDAELLQCNSTTLNSVELAIRITTSGWMRRLWTYQEGRIARDLYIQFADGAKQGAFYLMAMTSDGCGITPEVNDEGINAMHVVALEAMYTLMRVSHTVGHHSWTPRRDMGKILEAVRWRSTTRQTDELICIATLAGFEDKGRLKTLLDAPQEQRQKCFVDLQKRFPADIIFWDGPRMNDEGYGWCPCEFNIRDNMGRKVLRRVIGDYEVPLAEQTTHGIRVTWPGFRVGRFQTKDSFCWFVDSSCPKTLFHLDFAPFLVAGVGFKAENCENLMDSVAVIVRNCLEVGSPHRFETTDAVLVQIVREEDGVIFAKHRFPASITVFDDDNSFGLKYTNQDIQERYAWKVVAKDQEWCVG